MLPGEKARLLSGTEGVLVSEVLGASAAVPSVAVGKLTGTVAAGAAATSSVATGNATSDVLLAGCDALGAAADVPWASGLPDIVSLDDWLTGAPETVSVDVGLGGVVTATGLSCTPEVSSSCRP